MPNPKTVPFSEMPVGQWFLWCYPQEKQQPYRVVQRGGDARERYILFPDGRFYPETANVKCKGIPVAGPDVDPETAYQGAMRTTAGDVEPGTRFAIEWSNLGRREYVRLAGAGPYPGIVHAVVTHPSDVAGTVASIDAHREVEVL